MPVNVIEKGVYLTFDEIRILLYGMGVSEIEGIYMPVKVFSREDVTAAMHHMAERGFIEAAEDKFLIRADIRRMLEIVANPEQTGIWRPKGKEGPAFFLYMKGEQAVVSGETPGMKETMKITLFDKEAFARWREELTDDHHRGGSTGYGDEI